VTGNGHDGNGGLTPRFLELKRCVPKMRRWGNMTKAELDRLAAAPAFVVSFGPSGATIPPDVVDAAKTAVQAGLAPLPADPCLIEWVGPGLRSKLIVEVHVDPFVPEVWIMTPWSQGEHGWMSVIYTCAFRWMTWEYALEAVRGHELPTDVAERESAWVNNLVQAVAVAVYLCAEVGSAAAIRTAKPTTKALMQAKGLRGWDYRFVVLTPELLARAARSSPQGGTHAPPRWHLRRAHLRHLKSGKVVAVRSCEVGSAEHGGIVKDYRVEDPYEPEPPLPIS
jgi:hypothetical protein